jgi:hypothetical protein
LDQSSGGCISAIGSLKGLNRSTPVGTAWPSANLAILVPARLPQTITVYKLVVGAGATAAGNFDVGIYDAQGNLLVSSGSTAKGSSSEHLIDVTDTRVGPGVVYLALAADGTNNYLAVVPTGTTPVPLQKVKLYGLLNVASAFPLPSSIAFAAASYAVIPAIGAYLRGY